MRVLTLLLLYVSTFCQAQVTKTLNGTVRYESGMSETKFSTPNGDVVMKLPQSMSGAIISGTVSIEPAGKTEKEKARNLKELLKLVVMLDGQKIPVTTTPQTFDWVTNLDRRSRTPVELLNVSGVKVLELSLPPVLSTPAIGIWQPDRTPLLTTPSNVLVKGDALNVYTDQQFSPGEKFILTDSKGQQFTLKPICLSSQQAVMHVPEGVVPGDCTVREEVWNQPLPGYNVSSADFKLIDINLSSPNSDLRSGQTSSVTLSIDTRDPAEIDSNEFLVFTIDMKNLTPGVVDMAGGNIQTISFPLNENRQNPAAWKLSRTITGVKPGGFSVSATLHEDYNTSNDPFRPQLNVLKTPEEFNAWTTALKKDLQEYAGMHDNDLLGQVIKTNVQRAIDNMPVCTTPGQLDECKAVAYSLLRSTNVPKGAANTWPSGYEVFKVTISRFAEIEPTLIEFPTYINGLDFIERISYRNHDPSMIQDVTNARQLINTINEIGKTKENLNQLNQALRSLSSRTDQKLKANDGMDNGWKLTDLLFSTYRFNKRTKQGIDPIQSMIACLNPDKKILNVKPEYQQQVLNSLNAVPLGDGSYKINAVTATKTPVTYNIQVAPLLMATIYAGDWWAEYLIEEYVKKDTNRAKIITTHRDSTGTWYIFYKDAKCEETKYGKSEAIECRPDTEYDTKEGKSKPTGLYAEYFINPTGHCVRGTEFCTEVYVVSVIKYIYKDAKCKGLIKVETSYNFSCW